MLPGEEEGEGEGRERKVGRGREREREKGEGGGRGCCVWSLALCSCTGMWKGVWWRRRGRGSSPTTLMGLTGRE